MQQSYTDLHHIQRGILLSLAERSPQRFSELQPPRLANNTFSYHLKQLTDKQYLAHHDKQYTLTRKALKLVGMLNQGVSRRVSSPITVTTLYITNSLGEVLVVSRNQHPFRGWYGLPSGAIHVGETLEEAARRELFEKTTLSVDTPLTNIGVLDFQYCQRNADDVFFHAISFIFKLELADTGATITDIATKYGQLSWSKLGRDHILPDVITTDTMAHHSPAISHLSRRYIEPETAPVLASTVDINLQ